MKRRLFLRSLYMKGMALPAAYLLAPSLDAKGLPELPTADQESSGHGCGRTPQGSAKQKHHYIARDFQDPYLELIRLLKEASEIEHALGSA